MSVDTIAAVATGAGRAGIGIVRVSGPGVPGIARAIAGRELAPREAHYLPFGDADGTALDVGIALLFEAPNSFTGEHVLELQGHGGPVVLDLVLSRVLALGARAARPGEFSERAFLNDKLDLAQAEAIADLVESASGAAARAAVRSLAGDFSAEVAAVVAELDALRVWLEAALDFSDEDIDFLSDPDVERRAAGLVARFDALLARSEQGRRLREGLDIAIVGVPNVGKSSLLNALAGLERAIVTDVAGTTRDVLHEDIVLDGVPLHVVDTAGLRESEDPVEREGVVRARRAAAEADHVLLLVDASEPVLPEGIDELLPEVPRTLVVNKVDLLGAPSAARTSGAGARLDAGTPDAGEHAVDEPLTEAGVPMIADMPIETDGPPIAISARTGQGMDELRAHLLSLVGRDASIEGIYLARRRHLDALAEARAFADDALERLREGTMPELAAEELRLARQVLERITGHFDSEDLLGQIFSTFCVGK